MNGYLKNPTATEEAFAGGRFYTGDRAVVDPDGYVRIALTANLPNSLSARPE